MLRGLIRRLARLLGLQKKAPEKRSLDPFVAIREAVASLRSHFNQLEADFRSDSPVEIGSFALPAKKQGQSGEAKKLATVKKPASESSNIKTQRAPAKASVGSKDPKAKSLTNKTTAGGGAKTTISTAKTQTSPNTKTKTKSSK